MHTMGHEFCFVISGSGKYLHDQQSYQLNAGDIFISDPQTNHEISSHETKDLLIIFFNVYPTSLGEANKNIYEEMVIKQFIANHKIHASAQNHINQYLPFIQQQKGLSNFTDFRADEIVTLMILDMMEALSISEIKNHKNSQNVKTHLNKALNYISNHINTPIAVSDIAKHSHCSERHLRRLFKENFNHTIVDEINKMKIQIATKLLLMNYPVAKVASEVGIENHSQFSRLFKSVLGMTPKAYQMKYLVRVEKHRSYASKNRSCAPSAVIPRAPHLRANFGPSG